MVFDRINHVLEKKFFEYLLDLEIHKAVRYLYFFSLLVIQPNGNKGKGRTSENKSIKETISRLIREEIRETDVVGKNGKDQFFVILHQADFQQANNIGERILMRIKNYSFNIEGKEMRKNISIGGGCFPTHASDIDGLVAKVEEMLDKSKSEGGNKVSLPG